MRPRLNIKPRIGRLWGWVSSRLPYTKMHKERLKQEYTALKAKTEQTKIGKTKWADMTRLEKLKKKFKL